MKVLFASPGAAAYGSGRSMLNLLRARQFEAEVVCPGGGAVALELRQLGVKHHVLEFNKHTVRQNPRWHLGFYRAFCTILKHSRPDAVVINLDGNTPLVTLAALRAKTPIVRFSRFEFNSPRRWLDRWCWLQVEAVICPSEHVKQQVLEWAPGSFHPRVHRFYEPCDVLTVEDGESAAFRREFALGSNRIIGYVGRIHPSKRIETAVEALARVRRDIPDAHLLIVGGIDGSPAEAAYQKRLVELAAGCGVAEGVSITGYLNYNQVMRAVSTLSVLIHPSESESFGLVLVEAWAQGIPTVASDASGCREITRASGGGELCPVGDSDCFAECIVSLLQDPARAAALGSAGRSWVLSECSPAVYASRFCSLIECLARN